MCNGKSTSIFIILFLLNLLSELVPLYVSRANYSFLRSWSWVTAYALHESIIEYVNFPNNDQTLHLMFNKKRNDEFRRTKEWMSKREMTTLTIHL